MSAQTWKPTRWNPQVDVLLDDYGQIVAAIDWNDGLPSTWQHQCWCCDSTEMAEDGQCEHCGNGWCNHCGRRIWFDGLGYHHVQHPEEGCFLLGAEVAS